MGAAARGTAVSAFGRAVAEHVEELASLDAHNAGNPIRGMRRGAEQGARTLQYFAGLALQLTGQTIPASPDHLHFTLREPYGVVGVITPFNHPTLFATARTAAPLVAGNAVVLKPAHQTPLSALRLAEIAAQHLPPGVFNVITGRGETGAHLVRHPRVHRIAFTGGVPTALRIQADAAASGSVKHVSFELGGKNPLIIMPDVPIDEAADAAVEGMNLTRVLGQSCGSTSRAFVPRPLYRSFLDAVGDRLSALRMGPPEADETELGSLVSREQLDKVEHYVEAGRREGARLVLGGQRPGDESYARGFYFQPTMFADVDPGMQVATDEIFGPVLGVTAWEDEDRMIEAVNGVRYGLTASIYTRDLDTAMRLSHRVDAGYVWINDVEKRWIGVPFGGHKDSGTGTEYSIEELYGFSQNKSVSVALRT
jgi:acyl-CoA reductase-like NAD-dependent aldehyde dehydrogenase